MPYLITLSRIKTFLKTLSQITPYLNTLRRTIPHLITLPNYTPSYYITELYPILKLYRTISYLNTLPKYLFTWYSVTAVSAGVIVSPRRNNYPHGWVCKKKNFFFRKNLTVLKIVAQCRNHPILIH